MKRFAVVTFCGLLLGCTGIRLESQDPIKTQRTAIGAATGGALGGAFLVITLPSRSSITPPIHPPGIFLIGGPPAGPLPISAADVVGKKEYPTSYTLTSKDLDAFEHQVDILPLGEMVGLATDPQPPNGLKLKLFYEAIQKGSVPITFWNPMEPQPRTLVRLNSEPTQATLYTRGTPTDYRTNTGLYLSEMDIWTSTLELPGYAPCPIASAIIPGLLADGMEEARVVKCTLAPLATAPMIKGATKGGR